MRDTNNVAVFNASATNGLRMWTDISLNNYVFANAELYGAINNITAGNSIFANGTITQSLDITSTSTFYKVIYQLHICLQIMRLIRRSQRNATSTDISSATAGEADKPTTYSKTDRTTIML